MLFNENRTQETGRGVLKHPALNHTLAPAREPRKRKPGRKAQVRKGPPSIEEFKSTLQLLVPADVLEAVYDYLFEIVYLTRWTSLDTATLQQQVARDLNPQKKWVEQHDALVATIMEYFALKGAVAPHEDPHREPIRQITWRTLCAEQPKLAKHAKLIGARVTDCVEKFTETEDDFLNDDLVNEILQQCSDFELEPSCAAQIVGCVFDYMVERGVWG